jgi:hypothetical protein
LAADTPPRLILRLVPQFKPALCEPRMMRISIDFPGSVA